MNQRVVVLNGDKMNYDGKLDFSVLSPDTVVYDDSKGDEIVERIDGAAAVITKEMPVPAEIIQQFPDSVKLIVEAGTGYNNIDIQAAKDKGITVCNIPAYSTQRVAHTAVMLLLNLASSMRVQMAMLTKGDRRNFTDHLLVPHGEVNGKVLGIIGAGHIGREVMKIAIALGMEIVVYTRTPRPDEDHITYTDLETVLKTCDYLSIHCPLTEKTRHLIDRDAIALMKPSACIINTARGAIIDETALIEALQQHRLAGAGLDVQEVEPPVADSPLYTMEHVILTPHMGWKGLETRQRLVQIIAEDVRHFFDGDPVNVVSQ
ncbi:NAD(P)-dependent oxidoreductase [Megasphaera sp. AM44-1BH]|uniref:2-hydroxyacid dehydrogenase n=1 Tax=Megasphaera sp. AM44-1BH TaxID=2292358 RepID=UPI000E4EF569|nr:NAD(P)-dependent oxidoreductase [Megasphaera sp. AM44-1BH]RHA13758.1 D-2-hydroxyacid dehydrogenase [Megasphaera sp. AM44-1BH]